MLLFPPALTPHHFLCQSIGGDCRAVKGATVALTKHCGASTVATSAKDFCGNPASEDLPVWFDDGAPGVVLALRDAKVLASKRARKWRLDSVDVARSALTTRVLRSSPFLQ